MKDLRGSLTSSTVSFLSLIPLAGGFAALTILYPMYATDPTKNISYGFIFIWTITGYYAFFALFMLGVALRQKHIMHYCGFLKGVFMKSLFYIFLASLALCDIGSLWNDIIGGVMGVMAVLSWVTYCGKKDEAAKA